MNIWELDKLYLFIAFVIPGFISIKAYELLIPGEAKDSSKQLIDAITYSCLNYALLLWPILGVESGSLSTVHPVLYKIFYLAVLFIFPVLWVLIWKRIRTLEYFQKNAPHPTAKPWDFVFSQRQWYWVIVTLKNGEKIAGKYAGNSFSSSTPAKEQIYLEENWHLNNDGGFDRPRESTAGIIILADEIASVELFKFS
ncbi:DUF6338 family protein [Microbulbifer sp.]|uniref:DUF6338 family protein n=1 Tax=Microbulbifer sp. TaxID=1908541 RepID=UPI002584ACAC|nr:DUF6338 family protein [Microbulbifer sp.]